MKRRPLHFAALTLLLAIACTSIVAVLLPFSAVREQLDSVAGDGSADPYTPQLHARVQIYLAVLGIALGAAGVVMARRLSSAGTGRNESAAVDADVRRPGADSMLFLRSHARPLIALTLLAALIRWPWIDQPIRYDEAHTFIHYANRPLYVTVSTYAEPNNHVFHNVCVHLVTRVLGNDEWAIRLPALVAGVLTVPATYALAFLWGGGAPGWLAALAVAASSPLIEYSVNARGYSLVCLITLCLLLLAHAGLRRSGPAVWGTMSLLAALGLWTVPTMVYSLLLVLIWLIAARWRLPDPGPAMTWREIVAFPAVAAAVAVLLYSPILVVEGPGALSEAAVTPLDEPRPTLPVLVERLSRATDLLFRDLPWPALLLLAAGAMMTLHPARMKKNPAPGLVLVASGACIVLMLLQSASPPPRVWLFLLPPLFCAATCGLSMSIADWPPARRRTAVLAAGLLLVIWPAATTVWHDSIRRSTEGGVCPDAEVAVVWLRSNSTPDDAVIATTPCSAPLVYYALRHGLPLQHFDPPDWSTPREISAVIVVPTGRAGHVAPDEVLQELGLEDKFAGHRLEVVHEFDTVKLLRAIGPPTAP